MTAKTPEISRSHGIPIELNGMPTGFVAGGGYEGITETLDQAVERAAETLREAYGRDVQIRFNSDRRSGGAWLITHTEDGISANSEIGIALTLVDQRMIDANREIDAELGREDSATELRLGDILVCAHVRDTSLVDRSLRDADDWHTRSIRTPTGYVSTPIDGYLHRPMESIDAARDFLLAHAAPFANLEAATAEAEEFKSLHAIES